MLSKITKGVVSILYGKEVGFAFQVVDQALKLLKDLNDGDKPNYTDIGRLVYLGIPKNMKDTATEKETIQALEKGAEFAFAISKLFTKDK